MGVEPPGPGGVLSLYLLAHYVERVAKKPFVVSVGASRLSLHVYLRLTHCLISTSTSHQPWSGFCLHRETLCMFLKRVSKGSEPASEKTSTLEETWSERRH